MTKSHLTPGQRALIKAELDRRQNQLAAQLAMHLEGRGRVEHAQEFLNAEGDSTAHAADREIDLALSDRDLLELGAVSRALARVLDDNFGLCRACGEAIAFDRLRVEPQAERCIDCETESENQPSRSH